MDVPSKGRGNKLSLSRSISAKGLIVAVPARDTSSEGMVGVQIPVLPALDRVLALSLCVTAAFLARLCLLPWWDSGAVEL